MGFMDAAKSEGTTATGVALVRSARKSMRFDQRQQIYLARIAPAICCTNIFDFTVGYAAVKLTFRCRRRGVRLAKWSGR